MRKSSRVLGRALSCQPAPPQPLPHGSKRHRSRRPPSREEPTPEEPTAVPKAHTKGSLHLHSKDSPSATSGQSSSLNRLSEQKYRKHYKYIIGVDEAGRGPLAGPVVAAACIVLDNSSTQSPSASSRRTAGLSAGLSGIVVMDSKKTTEGDRVEAFAALTSNPAVLWEVCRLEHGEIDQLNILQATMAAMSRAVTGLFRKYPSVDPADCIVLVDGNRTPVGLPAAAEFIIKGDSLVYSIAAASIIAKVTRDRVMEELDSKYPLYGLAKHKGYPTLEHRTLLMKHGPSDIHRYSYRPVAEAAKAHNISFSVPEKGPPSKRTENIDKGDKQGSSNRKRKAAKDAPATRPRKKAK